MALNRLATGITEEGRQQAALGPNIGGLGLRRIKDIASPDELVAELAARPKVTELCRALAQARLASPNQFTNHLDIQITDIQQRLNTELDPF